MLDILNTPAIVAGGELNALGILRSLARWGVPVIVLDRVSDSPAMRSRYGTKIIVPSLEGTEFLDALQRIVFRAGSSCRAVLFLTEEKSVRTVSEHRALLPQGVSIRLPEHLRLMALMHKQGFQELAEAIGAPVPRTVRVVSQNDLVKLKTLRFPCVFKPARKDYGYGARFKKAYKVSSAAEVADLYREIEPVLADMVVQEWIEGADSEIYFCLQYISEDGKVVASFPGRKIRSWPLHIGGTASCTAAWDEADELSDMTFRFFTQVGFVGMGSMEYKRDSRNGRFFMVEPTVARTDFQEEVATVNGINLPLAAYRHELGLPPLPAARPARPLIWREPLSDKWALQESGGGPDPKSSGLPVVDAYWRLSDPMPWLGFMLDRLRQRLRMST